MSERDVHLLLEDILDAAAKILDYTSGMDYNQFIVDNKTIDATVRNFEIIGEAANRVPADYKKLYPQIEWRKIIGLRNRVIHEYFGIDYETIWNIKEDFLPNLIDWVQTLLKK